MLHLDAIGMQAGCAGQLQHRRSAASLTAARVFAGRKQRKDKEDDEDEETVAALVQGAPQPTTVTFHNVSSKIEGKKGGEKVILDKVSGKASPGRLLAVRPHTRCARRDTSHRPCSLHICCHLETEHVGTRPTACQMRSQFVP